MIYNNWFYNFLVAHKRLNALQCGYNKTSPLMRKYIKKITRGDREFLEVSARHFGKDKNVDIRILKIYQNDIRKITSRSIEEFLYMMSCNGFIEGQRCLATELGTRETHYADYIVHSYNLIAETYNQSKANIVNETPRPKGRGFQ